MNEKGSCIVSPASTQKEAIEMAPTELNKITNSPKELSCQYTKNSSGINKEKLS